MIYYLATEHAFYTLLVFLEIWQERLGHRLIPVSYRRLLQLKEHPTGTYIFSDLDRLTSEEAERVTLLWEQFSRNSGNRLLNHPLRSMQRYELLRHLHGQGFNRFNVYPLNERPASVAFPVFIRFANRHNGAITPLLFSPAELEQAVRGLIQSGEGLEDKLLVEFCDTADEDGIYRKYSAYLFGDQVVPSTLLFRRDWHVKHSDDVLQEQMHPEKARYLTTNPHEHELREIFRAAQIDFGRIDYAIRDGKIQTWEINTNPDISHLATKALGAWSVVEGISATEYLSEKFARAFETLDDSGAPAAGLRLWHLDKSQEILSAFEQSVPHSAPVVWVDGPESCGLGDSLRGRELMPFFAPDGDWEGNPLNDDAAICAVEKLRQGGAEFMVFTWPSFWWFEYYPRFYQYLQSKFSFPVQEELLEIIDLRRSIAARHSR